MTNKIVIVSSTDGTFRRLNDALSKPMSAVGDVVRIYRNSHVEPTSELRDEACGFLLAHNAQLSGTPAEIRQQLPQNKWWADMTPLDGPVIGPFDDNQQALNAEIIWLQEHHIPLLQEHHDRNH